MKKERSRMVDADDKRVMEKIVQDKMRRQGLLMEIESIEDNELLSLLEELNRGN